MFYYINTQKNIYYNINIIRNKKSKVIIAKKREMHVNISLITNKKLCTIFYLYYAVKVFSFLANLDFFLAAVFFTITPFVQA